MCGPLWWQLMLLSSAVSVTKKKLIYNKIFCWVMHSLAKFQAIFIFINNSRCLLSDWSLDFTAHHEWSKWKLWQLWQTMSLKVGAVVWSFPDYGLVATLAIPYLCFSESFPHWVRTKAAQFNKIFHLFCSVHSQGGRTTVLFLHRNWQDSAGNSRNVGRSCQQFGQTWLRHQF